MFLFCQRNAEQIDASQGNQFNVRIKRDWISSMKRRWNKVSGQASKFAGGLFDAVVVESQRGNYLETPYKNNGQKALENKRKSLKAATTLQSAPTTKTFESLTKQTSTPTSTTNHDKQILNITTAMTAVVDKPQAVPKTTENSVQHVTIFTPIPATTQTQKLINSNLSTSEGNNSSPTTMIDNILQAQIDEVELGSDTVPANYDMNVDKSTTPLQETPKPIRRLTQPNSTSSNDYASQSHISDNEIKDHNSGNQAIRYVLENPSDVPRNSFTTPDNYQALYYKNGINTQQLGSETTSKITDYSSTTTIYTTNAEPETTETNTDTYTTNSNAQGAERSTVGMMLENDTSAPAAVSFMPNKTPNGENKIIPEGTSHSRKIYRPTFNNNSPSNNDTRQTRGLNKRRKRQTEQINNQEQEAEAILGDDNQENRCVSIKELEDHKFAERKHLDNLRKELDKLEGLVNVLKEQQSILNSLNKIDTQYSQNHLMRSEKEQEKHIIYLLEDLDTKVSNLNATKLNQNSNTIEEISNLKQEVQKLRNFVDMHMQSKIETDNEKELAAELQKQKEDIADIKITLQDIIFSTKPLNASGKSLNASSRLRMSEGDFIHPDDIQREINGIQRQLQSYLSRRRSEHVGTVQEDYTQNIPELIDLQNSTEEIMQFVEKALREEDDNGTNIVLLKQQKAQLNEIKRTIDDILEPEKNISERISPSSNAEEPVLGLIPDKPVRLSFKNRDVTFHDLPTKPNILGKSRTSTKKSSAKSRGAKSSNSEENLQNTRKTSEARSSDSDDLKKLLREIDLDVTEEDLTSSELESKIRNLEKQLKSATKRKKKTDLETQIKILQRQVKQMQKEKELDEVESKTDNDEDMKTAIKKVMRAIKKLDDRGKGLDEDNVENELRKLQQAIDNLRGNNNGFDFAPKADETAQFQIMLNKILSQQGQSGQSPLSQHSQPVPNQQQMQFLTNKLIEMQKGSNTPSVPYGNMGFYKGSDSNPNYFQANDFVYPSNVPNANTYTYQRPNPGPSNFNVGPYPDSANSDYANQKQQLFRGYEKPYGEDYVQGGNGEEYGAQKLGPNADQNVKYNTYAKQSIEGLKQQIHDLQNVIANLNSPTYAKKPEDEATIYKLDQQINDLKNVVNNLNQYPESGNAAYPEPHNARKTEESKKEDATIGHLRKSRSTDDEKTGEVIDALSKLFENAFSNGNQESHVEEVLQKAAPSDVYENAKQKLADLQKQLGMSPLSNFINN